jgi:hypothetical protein
MMTTETIGLQANQIDNDYLSQRVMREGPPKYGYPPNHLPHSTVERLEFVTSFLSAKRNKVPSIVVSK